MSRQAISIALSVAMASAAISSEDPRELRSFAPEGSRCAFSTVGGRKPVTVAYQRGEGTSEAKGQLFCFDQLHCRCQVRYVDLPASAQDLSCVDIASRYGFEAWSRDGRFEKTGTVKTGEHEGDEYTVTGLPVEVRVRVFVVAHRAVFCIRHFPSR